MLITNFSSGELSPTLNGRVDLQQYYQAASRLENFEIIPTGGIKRRAGTKRLVQLTKTVETETTDPETEETTTVTEEVDANARIIPFILDKDNVFIFALIEKAIKVYTLNADSTVTLLQTLEEGIDYASMFEINQIQYAQNYDTMYLVHNDYDPVMIKWNEQGTNMFRSGKIHFDFYPDVEVDDDYDFVMIPANAFPIKEDTADGHLRFSYSVQNGTATVPKIKDFNSGIDTVYCIYDGHLWVWSNASGWLISGSDPDIDLQLFTTPSKRPGCVAFFNNRLYLASSQSKPGAVWASATPSTTDTRYNDFNTYKKYVTVERTPKEADLHTFTCDLRLENINVGANTTTLVNVTQNFTIEGTLIKDKTNYFVSGPNIPVGAKVVDVTANTITINTANIPITENMIGQVMTIQLWKNPTNPSAEDYEYIVANTNVTTADCGFYFELASDENDAIKFMSCNRYMAIGTESSIWSLPNDINALNIAAVMQGRYGSDDIQGMAVAQATVYFAQGKKGIREFYYDSMAEAFQTNNIAILAEHLLQESTIIDFDYMSNPYSRIMCLRYDGTVASMLYDKTNGVMGWNRITRTAGKFVSVATTRGQNENDYIFFVTEDNGKHYLEMLDPSSQIFLDSWMEYSADIEGYENAVLWNKSTGKSCGMNDIPDDFISEGDVVYIGYPIRSYIKSMPVMANDPTGKKRITNLIVRFLDSYMPLLTVTGLPAEKFTTITDLPYSGVAQITYPGSSNRDVYFELETSDMDPVNILSVNANVA